MPFRRLCASFGAEATMSEMSYARHLIKGDKVERSHLKRAENEQCFGEDVALATCSMELYVAACCCQHMQTTLFVSIVESISARVELQVARKHCQAVLCLCECISLIVYHRMQVCRLQQSRLMRV